MVRDKERQAVVGDDVNTNERDWQRDVEAIALRLGITYETDGRAPEAGPLSAILARIDDHLRIKNAWDELHTLRPRSEAHEDDGCVLWWTVPVREPPYVGTEIDDIFPEYATHWSPLPKAYAPMENE